MLNPFSKVFQTMVAKQFILRSKFCGKYGLWIQFCKYTYAIGLKYILIIFANLDNKFSQSFLIQGSSQLERKTLILNLNRNSIKDHTMAIQRCGGFLHIILKHSHALIACKEFPKPRLNLNMAIQRKIKASKKCYCLARNAVLVLVFLIGVKLEALLTFRWTFSLQMNSKL